jgi:AraC-like DNA-binding protein
MGAKPLQVPPGKRAYTGEERPMNIETGSTADLPMATARRAAIRPTWSILRPVRVRHYLSVMSERGISADRVLKGTGIVAHRLQDADYWVLPQQVRAVIGNLVDLSGGRSTGFEMGLRTDMSALGILAGALLSCREVEQTLDVWSRFSEPVAGIMSRLLVDSSNDDELLLTVISRDASPDIQQFCVEEILGLMKKLGEAESGMAPVLRSLEVAYPKPAHAALYREVLDCPVRFDAAQTQVRVLRAWARRPIISHDRELNDLCLNRCSQIVERLMVDTRAAPIAQQIYQLVLRNPRRLPDLEDAARHLKTSARTLKRRLQGEGLSFQAILRQCRTDLAVDYLGLGRMPAHKVADLLGFGDERSFRRAFKTWTGRPPSDYQATTQAN